MILFFFLFLFFSIEIQGEETRFDDILRTCTRMYENMDGKMFLFLAG